MQFAAATPSCAFYQEFSIAQGTGADPFMVDACLPTDGTIVVPDAPGFGVTLDEKQLHETLDVL
jgi:L-alanine-DL-glutamate epimerase-like enolase superfamily enzyme